MLRREDGSLSRPFVRKTGVHEIQFYNWEASGGELEGIDLGGFFTERLRRMRRWYWRECVRQALGCPRARFWKRVWLSIGGVSHAFAENNRLNPQPGTRACKVLGATLYRRERFVRNNAEVVRQIVAGGVLTFEKCGPERKYRCLGLTFWRVKLREKRVTRFFGIPVKRTDRRDEYLGWFAQRLREAAGTLFGPGRLPDHVILLRHNIGENVVYLAALRRWLKALGAKRPMFVLWREKDRALLRLFSLESLPIAHIVLAQTDINAFFKSDFTMIDGMRVHTPTYAIAQRMKAYARRHPQVDVHFRDWILQSMALATDTPLERPAVTPSLEQQAGWWLAQAGVKSPFVLLCPEAVSLQSLKDDFWNELIDDFRAQGFDVLVNHLYGDGFKPPEGVFGIHVPVDVLFALARKAERIVSMASGLGVLLAQCGTRIDLLYTPFKSRGIGYDAQDGIDFYGVEPVSGHDRVVEWNMEREAHEKVKQSLLAPRVDTSESD